MGSKYFDEHGAFQLTEEKHAPPYTSIDKHTKDILNFEGFDGLNGQFSLTKDSENLSSIVYSGYPLQQIRIDACEPTQFFQPIKNNLKIENLNSFYLMNLSSQFKQLSFALHYSPIWANINFLKDKSDSGIVLKSQYSNKNICTQIFGTTIDPVVGGNFVYNIIPSTSVGLELLRKPQGEITFSASGHHKQLVNFPLIPQLSSFDITQTITLFAQLITSLSVQVSSNLKLATKIQYTLPVPSEMRLGVKPEPPKVSIGCLYKDQNQNQVKASLDVNTSQLKFIAEKSILKGLGVGVSLNGSIQSKELVGWGFVIKYRS
eukprot:c17041_g2_i1.p1 GENE.c17041_g2_i1~~c17041_g2_i1.p1  ORF type:complete len:326 (+),score=111.48 c17041_g2_i1:27-980(+)